MGDHYLPSDSPYRGAGSTTADQVGLYWYTTQTNQVPQGASQVDLGYHYRATDSYGNPLDDNGDGAIWGAPSITTQPASQTVAQGGSVTFSVAATGSAPLTYQWQFNGNNISGATSSTYSITSAQTNDAGTYSVVVSNAQGSVMSGNATLTVNPPIQFAISFTNQYVNQANVPLWLDIQSGTPLYYAVMVDSTSFSSASWTAYTSSNITVNLGSTQGWHTVWVGLCDMLGGVPCWNAVRLELLLTPPAITITSPGPGTNTVDQPLLQLQGYAPEELSSVTYDISNAAGTLTGQPAVVLSRHYDTNLGQFTTNTFQAFDLDLTVGANQITLHASDMAGNMSTSNYTYTLDYSSKTNPPVIGLYWPQRGAQICGTSFTWRGWVDDPTATVSARIVDSNGDTNVVDGIVERNGNFWVENLPLAPEMNLLTLTATDAVGNTNATNIYVFQSLVNLTFTNVPDITSQTTVQVPGTVDSGYTVWVNGVQAANFGGGAWLAYNVPVNGAGTAVFQAMAVASSVSLTGGGGGTNSTLLNLGNPTPSVICPVAEYAPDKKPAIICTTYALTSDVLWTDAHSTPTITLIMNVGHWLPQEIAPPASGSTTTSATTAKAPPRSMPPIRSGMRLGTAAKSAILRLWTTITPIQRPTGSPPRT